MASHTSRPQPSITDTAFRNTSYGNVQQVMATCDKLRQRATSYGKVRQVMAMCDKLWQCATSYGNVCQVIAMRHKLWQCATSSKKTNNTHYFSV